MSEGTQVPRVAMQVARGCLVATIQIELDDEVLRRFQEDLLRKIESTDAVGVLLDLSGVDVMDLHTFQEIRRTVTMASLMGRSSVLVGIQPGVASTLVEMDADLEGLVTALTLEEGLDLVIGAGAADEEEGPPESEAFDAEPADEEEEDRGP